MPLDAAPYRASGFVHWHVSDVPILPTKVGYEGQSGSDGDIVKPTRLNP
jgi:hypothetical protein